MEPFGGVWMNPNMEFVDESNMPNYEKVIEASNNGRYSKLNTVLGRGACKVVYKAIDKEEGYEVAWNVIQVTMLVSVTRQESRDLGHEIDILKSVRHPNIITFHDAWYNETEFVFITELMTSGTLREYIRKLTPLPNIKIVKRWCRQILKGLAYLHGHEPPIIHRDIKCDNIFINGAHGEIKIGDMGTAEMKIGKKYTVIGTPEFMAPEMYEEQGYNEKVDIYAFGMCLLEMATGEYPYGECTNAVQVFKKVTQTIKPECISRVQDPEVLTLVHMCLTPEDMRMSAQEILEHEFLAVEPEVVLVSTDMTMKLLTLQLVFKGMDKLSVKFEFNADTDTAADVVAEMIEEQVLPQCYQQLMTCEINRILRDMNRNQSADRGEDEKIVWRRENDIRSELDRAKKELALTLERAAEAEKKFELIGQHTLFAEERCKDTLQALEQAKGQIAEQQSSSPENTTIPSEYELSKPCVSGEESTELSGTHSTLMNHILAGIKTSYEYSNSTDIEKFVMDTAAATNRNKDKAKQWVEKLQNQDIMTVGDLRDLHDEDWSGIGLTVFALRALKNMLAGKQAAGLQRSLQGLQSGSSTPVEEKEHELS
ncbi:putative serine/threonine-specific protein kinase pkpA Phycomyces blakesleeanus [Spinellus fusiger]|nr:putative serine/threonine-specific protein kinase pkpA Phycomyces blakesleeanus [Spinellus fusiger]